jgi:hypothetical protein
VTNIASATTTIKWFAVDAAGNPESVKSGTWTIHAPDMTASIQINNGATLATSTLVTLTLAASDPQGVATMQFSNDDVTYTAEEQFAQTRSWTLTSGDGDKTVYVRFRDRSLPSGYLYPPVKATITFAAKDGLYPGSAGYLESALKALKIAQGLETASIADIAHCDVAPYYQGGSAPDGKIDLLDVYAILSRMVGLITNF